MANKSSPRTGKERLLKYVAGGRVCTSSELIRSLSQSGLTEANARQLISRHSNTGEVWRSQHLKLARDERLFAEKKTVGTPWFFAAVGEKLRQTSRHGLARCVAALAAHGTLHRVDLMRLLAVPIVSDPVASTRSVPSYADEVTGLQELGARLIQQHTAFESIVAPGSSDADAMDSLAHRACEQMRCTVLLTRILAERLRRQNMLSWNRVELPDMANPFAVFNTHLFSAYGFSYLSPVVRWKEETQQPTPCPVLIDCYHGLCTLAQVESFIQRVDRATIRRKRRLTTLGVIAARDFDRDAWTAARRRGLMTVSFRQMFGDEALEAMIEVEKLLTGLGHEGASKGQERFQEITQLIDELRTNPVVVDLRSIGLEALCGLILQSQGYANLELGRVVPWRDTTRDVDVFAVRGDELRIVECKAYHRRKSIDQADVRKFFTQTVPALKKWMRQTDRMFARCTAEIWTTGPKGKDADETLHALRPPNGDIWDLRRMRDMHEEIPKRIRNRSIKLLESIALTETSVDSESTPVDGEVE